MYVNKDGQPLSKADLDNLVRTLWLDEHADYNRGDWCIVCHPITHGFIHGFDISYRRTERTDTGLGFHVDEFHSKVGKIFPILLDRYMRPDTLVLANFDAFSYGYFAGDAVERQELATQGRYRRWLISFQAYGLVARNPRSNIGMIRGLPTT